MATLNFHINGTHCASCKVLIEDVCSEMPGVVSCDVNPQTGNVVLEYEGDLDTEKLKNEIEALGKYKVTF